MDTMENAVKMDDTELEGVSGGVFLNPRRWGKIIGYYWSDTYGKGVPCSELLGKTVLVEDVADAEGPLKLRLWYGNMSVGWTVPGSIQLE